MNKDKGLEDLMMGGEDIGVVNATINPGTATQEQVSTPISTMSREEINKILNSNSDGVADYVVMAKEVKNLQREQEKNILNLEKGIMKYISKGLMAVGLTDSGKILNKHIEAFNTSGAKMDMRIKSFEEALKARQATTRNLMKEYAQIQSIYEQLTAEAAALQTQIDDIDKKIDAVLKSYYSATGSAKNGFFQDKAVLDAQKSELYKQLQDTINLKQKAHTKVISKEQMLYLNGQATNNIIKNLQNMYNMKNKNDMYVERFKAMKGSKDLDLFELAKEIKSWADDFNRAKPVIEKGTELEAQVMKSSGTLLDLSNDLSDVGSENYINSQKEIKSMRNKHDDEVESSRDRVMKISFF